MVPSSVTIVEPFLPMLQECEVRSVRQLCARPSTGIIFLLVLPSQRAPPALQNPHYSRFARNDHPIFPLQGGTGAGGSRRRRGRPKRLVKVGDVDDSLKGFF